MKMILRKEIPRRTYKFKPYLLVTFKNKYTWKWFQVKTILVISMVFLIKSGVHGNINSNDEIVNNFSNKEDVSTQSFSPTEDLQKLDSTKVIEAEYLQSTDNPTTYSAKLEEFITRFEINDENKKSVIQDNTTSETEKESYETTTTTSDSSDESNFYDTNDPLVPSEMYTFEPSEISFSNSKTFMQNLTNFDNDTKLHENNLRVRAKNSETNLAKENKISELSNEYINLTDTSVIISNVSQLKEKDEISINNKTGYSFSIPNNVDEENYKNTSLHAHRSFSAFSLDAYKVMGTKYHYVLPSIENATFGVNTTKNNNKKQLNIDWWEVPYTDFDAAVHQVCEENEKICFDKSKCIGLSAWCNNIVDCEDGSDELNCTCKERMDQAKVCDGYFDCPNGEDEEECFGCPKDLFSCADVSSHKLKSTCIPMSKRCDNHNDCGNHKDEKDCQLLSDKIYAHQKFVVSYNSGYLHRNWKGNWYPVCIETSINAEWAIEACQSELGYSNVKGVHIEIIPFSGNYREQFIMQNVDGSVEFLEHCQEKGLAVHVECPPVYCGSRINFENNMQRYMFKRHIPSSSYTEKPELDEKLKFIVNVLRTIEKIKNSSTVKNTFVDDDVQKNSSSEVPVNYTSNGDNTSSAILKITGRSNNNEDNNSSAVFVDKHYSNEDYLNKYEDFKNLKGKEEEEKDNSYCSSNLRVVGGCISQPGKWPWLVVVYKNGVFHCGGVILDREWIMTAAHCMRKYRDNYFEIQAGVLRRYSSSPMEQTRVVTHTVMHPDYNDTIMSNDIALLKINSPLKFNRWVRPVCLPEERPPWGPHPGVKCTAVGWGATKENGKDPDNLREVEVPISSNCKYLVDNRAHEICAGFVSGGRDTCQGDSGGPLLCRIPSSKARWYVAGIVSHGEGCARPMEPGAYTRVALFLHWLVENTDDKVLTRERRSVQECPSGIRCKDDNRCIARKNLCDGIIDCLRAEDEIDCIRLKNKYKVEGSVDGRNYPESNFTNGTAPVDSFPDLNDWKSKEDYLNRLQTTVKSNILVIPESNESYKNNSSYFDPANSFLYVTNITEFDEFVCRIFPQNIPNTWYCDGEIDCEDGTDELNCTCSNLLKSFNASLICNGEINCYDSSDEINCNGQNYTENEFYCYKSNRTIKKTELCNGVKNCPNGEDEMNCYALTNGTYIEVDIFGVPAFNQEGIITVNNNGIWNLKCLSPNERTNNKQHEIVSEICRYFGFNDYETFTEILIKNTTLPVYSFDFLKINYCWGLRVTCKTVIEDQALQPWRANIYINGSLQCIGLFLTESWIIANYECCLHYDPRKDYIVATSEYHTDISFFIQTYNEQILNIDEVKCFTTKTKIKFMMAHLNVPAKLTKYTKFLGIPLWMPIQHIDNTSCLLIASDSKNTTITIDLLPHFKNCLPNKKCFTVKNNVDLCNFFVSKLTGAVCLSTENNWHLSAIINSNKSELCSTNANILQFEPFENVMEDTEFFQLIEKELSLNTNSTQCDGYRCKLGKCIQWTEVCDGKSDCRNEEDEMVEKCELKNTYYKNRSSECSCKIQEFQCRNSRCISKSKICNGIDDCGDNSDEFFECSKFSCANYLNLTAPHKLCNFEQDCEDRSDEDPKLCSLTCHTNSSFQCSSSDTCIPMSFVCDGIRDCPDGEDERTCMKLENELAFSNEGILMLRSYGKWEKNCISSDFIQHNLGRICETLHFKQLKKSRVIPGYKILNSTISSVQVNENLTIVMKRTKTKGIDLNHSCNYIYLECE